MTLSIIEDNNFLTSSSPEAIGRLLNRLKGQLEGLPESIIHIKDSVSHHIIKVKIVSFHSYLIISGKT